MVQPPSMPEIATGTAGDGATTMDLRRGVGGSPGSVGPEAAATPSSEACSRICGGEARSGDFPSGDSGTQDGPGEKGDSSSGRGGPRQEPAAGEDGGAFMAMKARLVAAASGVASGTGGRSSL